MRLKPYEPGRETEGLTEDYAKAEKIGRYRVGKRAFYFPAFTSAAYVPYEDITEVKAGKMAYSAHTCSGSGSTKLDIVTLRAGGRIRNFQCDSEKNAERLARALKRRIGLAAE